MLCAKAPGSVWSGSSEPFILGLIFMKCLQCRLFRSYANDIIHTVRDTLTGLNFKAYHNFYNAGLAIFKSRHKSPRYWATYHPRRWSGSLLIPGGLAGHSRDDSKQASCCTVLTELHVLWGDWYQTRTHIKLITSYLREDSGMAWGGAGKQSFPFI